MSLEGRVTLAKPAWHEAKIKMLGQAEKAEKKMQFLTVDFLGVPLAYQEEPELDYIYIKEAMWSWVTLIFFWYHFSYLLE